MFLRTKRIIIFHSIMNIEEQTAIHFSNENSTHTHTQLYRCNKLAIS